MSIQNIYEIFTLNGEAFVSEVYHVLLDREADAQGLAYYCGRMAAGYSKSYIVYQIYISSEAIASQKNVGGLAQLIKNERRAQSPVWQFFKHGSQNDFLRQERYDSLLASLKAVIHDEITQCVESMSCELESIRSLIDIITENQKNYKNITMNKYRNSIEVTKGTAMNNYTRRIYGQLKQNISIKREK